MPGYNIWTEHGEQFVSEPLLEHEHDNQTADGLDEMLADFGDAMHSVEEEPTADAKAFYDMLAASKGCIALQVQCILGCMELKGINLEHIFFIILPCCRQ